MREMVLDESALSDLKDTILKAMDSTSLGIHREVQGSKILFSMRPPLGGVPETLMEIDDIVSETQKGFRVKIFGMGAMQNAFYSGISHILVMTHRINPAPEVTDKELTYNFVAKRK